MKLYAKYDPLCTCGHKASVHLHRCYDCMDVACKCDTFLPKREPYCAQPFTIREGGKGKGELT